MSVSGPSPYTSFQIGEMKRELIASILYLTIPMVVWGRWHIDPRCPDPVNRRLEETAVRKRKLLEEQEEPFEGDGGQNSFEKNMDYRATNLTNYGSSSLRRYRRLAMPEKFHLKMKWNVGYCWQEEWDIHRRWCWECHGSRCSEGDRIYIQWCEQDKATQYWTYEEKPNEGGGKLRPASDPDLCLERTSIHGFHLKYCRHTERQIFTGFDWQNPFELKPHSRPDYCLNQDHHPRAGERLETTHCRTARHWYTNEWVLYFPEDDDGAFSFSDKLMVRYKGECNENNKCELCTGDCDRDSHCEGNLVCLQRHAFEPVEGCIGVADFARDYCVDPNPAPLPPAPTLRPLNRYDTRGVVLSTTQAPASPGVAPSIPTKEPTSIEPTTRPTEARKKLVYVRECSRQNPCGLCEGDCDSDSGCLGDMICYHLHKAGSVPGCLGYDRSRTDFCINPNP